MNLASFILGLTLLFFESGVHCQYVSSYSTPVGHLYVSEPGIDLLAREYILPRLHAFLDATLNSIPPSQFHENDATDSNDVLFVVNEFNGGRNYHVKLSFNPVQLNVSSNSISLSGSLLFDLSLNTNVMMCSVDSDATHQCRDQNFPILQTVCDSNHNPQCNNVQFCSIPCTKPTGYYADCGAPGGGEIRFCRVIPTCTIQTHITLQFSAVISVGIYEGMLQFGMPYSLSIFNIQTEENACTQLPYSYIAKVGLMNQIETILTRTITTFVTDTSTNDPVLFMYISTLIQKQFAIFGTVSVSSYSFLSFVVLAPVQPVNEHRFPVAVIGINATFLLGGKKMYTPPRTQYALPPVTWDTFSDTNRNELNIVGLKLSEAVFDLYLWDATDIGDFHLNLTTGIDDAAFHIITSLGRPGTQIIDNGVVQLQISHGILSINCSDDNLGKHNTHQNTDGSNLPTVLNDTTPGYPVALLELYNITSNATVWNYIDHHDDDNVTWSLQGMSLNASDIHIVYPIIPIP
eukprot:PhF_6_TR25533/c0_g1_i2/m.35772